jgi:hypothetical protein
VVCLSTYLLIQKIPAIVPNPATITAKSGQRHGDSPIRYVNSPTTDMTAKMEATNPYSMNNRRNPFTCPHFLSPSSGKNSSVYWRDAVIGLGCARPTRVVSDRALREQRDRSPLPFFPCSP